MTDFIRGLGCGTILGLGIPALIFCFHKVRYWSKIAAEEKLALKERDRRFLKAEIMREMQDQLAREKTPKERIAKIETELGITPTILEEEVSYSKPSTN